MSAESLSLNEFSSRQQTHSHKPQRQCPVIATFGYRVDVYFDLLLDMQLDGAHPSVSLSAAAVVLPDSSLSTCTAAMIQGWVITLCTTVSRLTPVQARLQTPARCAWLRCHHSGPSSLSSTSMYGCCAKSASKRTSSHYTFLVL